MTKQQIISKKSIETFRSVIEASAADGQVPTDIQILKTGSWQTPWHGDFEVTEADIDEYIENFDNQVIAKGIAIDADHRPGDGAVGWVEKLYKKPGTNEVSGESEIQLWATIEWNVDGTEMLAKRKFRFFSPEFAPTMTDPLDNMKILTNVLIGGGITNRPLFRDMTQIMANATGGEKGGLQKKSGIPTLLMKASTQEESPMPTLEEVLAKKPEDLTDEDRQVLKENSAKLTDEQKETFKDALAEEAAPEETPEGEGAKPEEGAPAEGEGDEPAKDEPSKEASTKSVTISASTLDALKADAAMGRQAAEKLDRVEASAKMNGMVISANSKDGRIPAEMVEPLTDFYVKCSATQRKELLGLLTKLPTQQVTASIGASEAGTAASFDAIDAAANDLIKASGGTLGYGDAIKQVRRQKPELLKAHDEEVKETKA